jgi:alpha-L-fucosidase
MSNTDNHSLVAPSKEQIEWVKTEMGVIIHFDVQVFEPDYNWRAQWGYTPSPEVFNPKNLDTDQWIETASKAGAKYAILVAKHCSGFSLWPTDAHDYHVGNTPWKDGKGDLVADFIASCEKYDVKPGIYCSASANAYMEVENPGRVVGGTDEDNQNYNDMVMLQLTELWSNYGPLSEVWFDGGVIPEEEGGPAMKSLREKLQPQSVVMGAPYGCHNRVRHSGAEDATAMLPAWGTVNGPKRTRAGDPDGDEYMPIEADMPNRKAVCSFQGGWFWHKGQDTSVYPVADLFDRYYKSVGRNANFLIGMVVDNRGLVPDVDKKTFETFGEVIERLYNLPRDTVSGEGKVFEVDITTGDYVSEALIREEFSQGERVRKYSIQASVDDLWVTVADGECIGSKRLIEFPKVKTTKVRLLIEESIGTPYIEEFSIYFRIPLGKPPEIERDDEGIITIEVPKECKVYYTFDGSEPTADSMLYEKPFQIKTAGCVRAVSLPIAGFDERFPELMTNLVIELYFGDLPIGWDVIDTDSEYDEHNLKENILLHNSSPWISGKDAQLPHEIVVDMKAARNINGFIYTPYWASGYVLQYDFYVGNVADDVSTLVCSGSFPDIMNMPIPQVVKFDQPTSGRYFRFVATANAQGLHFASIGNFEII